MRFDSTSACERRQGMRHLFSLKTWLRRQNLSLPTSSIVLFYEHLRWVRICVLREYYALDYGFGIRMRYSQISHCPPLPIIDFSQVRFAFSQSAAVRSDATASLVVCPGLEALI